MDDQELEKIYLEVSERLEKLPGVDGVGYGLKERGGKVTDEIVFRVYVREKKASGQINPEEVIPAEIHGIGTDVIQTPTFKKIGCPDLSSYSDAKGGIGIANLNEFEEVLAGTRNTFTMPLGTLGCICTIDGNTTKDKYALITNNHVLAHQNGRNGDTIYNPKLTPQGPAFTIVVTQDRDDRNPIGKITDIGLDGNYSYQYDGDPAPLEYHVDCGAAKISTNYSSWCDTNCGQGFANKIEGLGLGGNDAVSAIKRIRLADANSTLYKVGRRTGKTSAIIVDPLGTLIPSSGPHLKRIMFLDTPNTNCLGNQRMAEEGDSGAALITPDREIAGLVFAVGTTNPNRTFGCHIHPCMHRLGLTPLNTASNPAPSQMGVQGILAPPEETAHFNSIKQRFEQSKSTALLAEMIREHRTEITQLVNYKRAVTVTWHRNKGPDFMGHILQSMRDPNHDIPKEIEGVCFVDALTAMGDILIQEGSPVLERNIKSQYNSLHSIAHNINKAEDIFQLLEKQQIEVK